MNTANTIATLVANPESHARFLNTLSFMENSGARKISKFEHKKEVSLIILKHAAEEHRHAYYLKKQISKLVSSGFETYDDSFLINPRSSRFYLDVLDLRISQYAKKKLGLTGYDVKWAAYLLVTYAIELRADELYPIYQQILTETKSKVQVKSIIVEEEGHLEEMISQLKATWPDWEQHAAVAVQIETELYQDWVSSLVAEVA